VELEILKEKHYRIYCLSGITKSSGRTVCYNMSYMSYISLKIKGKIRRMQGHAEISRIHPSPYSEMSRWYGLKETQLVSLFFC